MNSLARKIMILGGAAALPFAAAHAVKAFPGLLTYTQPDGTEISVKKVGDERGHYLLTSDGVMLEETSAGLCYAAMQGGAVVSSGRLAADPALRSAADRSFLASLDQKALVSSRLSSISATPRNLRRSATRAEAAGYPQGYGLVPGSVFPVTGSPKVLVILVEFADKKFAEANPLDYYTRMMNEPGFSTYGATGSAMDYFTSNSHGLFTPEIDVYGPVTVSKSYSYYGKNVNGEDAYPDVMIEEACQGIKDITDLKQYDNDGDGKVDNVFVFYAGYGEATSNDSKTIWPHQWDISEARGEAAVVDGVEIDHYACTCEIDGYLRRTDGVGTFLHEFSHVMGLPDLYCTSNATVTTVDEWDIMDCGNYNNDGMTPPNYSSFEKYAFGWVEPVLMNRTMNVELPEWSESNACYIVPASDSGKEYFLFENRQQVGNDLYLPGHDMLIWHIDYIPNSWTNNTVNNNAKHQYIDLVEATSATSSRASQSFPGTRNVTSFGAETTPAFVNWEKKSLRLELTDIAESAGLITFRVTKEGDTGVSEVEAAPLAVEYYDFAGNRLSSPQGLCLKRILNPDGTSTTLKILR